MSLKDTRLIDLYNLNKRTGGSIDVGDPLFFIYEKILNGQELDPNDLALIKRERDEIWQRFQDINADIAHGEQSKKLPSSTI